MQRTNDVLREATQAHMHGDWPRAEYLYDALLTCDEDNWLLHFALGSLYAQAAAYGRAIAFLRRSLELRADNREAMENLGACYRALENHPKAKHWYDEALKLKRSAIVLANMSGLHINSGAPEWALVYADEALAAAALADKTGDGDGLVGDHDPVTAAKHHKSLGLLELGRYEEAWPLYESRLDLPQFHRRPYKCPRWQGEPVKLLAIHGEQGLGDEIMFLTCVKQIRERYQVGRIVVECNPRLRRLLHNSLGVKCYGTHAELVGAQAPDAYIAMGSLPGMIWPLVPNAYLKPTTIYGRTERPRIGLSWYGGAQGTHMQLRNTPVENWRVLLTDDAEYFSLQYGDRAEEAATLGVARHDAGAIHNLDRLAALVKSCDLVVSVCNTTVHMAGALGVPCLCLVPDKPAWRYGLTGSKMVWYDSVTMIRQGKDEQWPGVLERARKWIGNHRQLSAA